MKLQTSQVGYAIIFQPASGLLTHSPDDEGVYCWGKKKKSKAVILKAQCANEVPGLVPKMYVFQASIPETPDPGWGFQQSSFLIQMPWTWTDASQPLMCIPTSRKLPLRCRFSPVGLQMGLELPIS